MSDGIQDSKYRYTKPFQLWKVELNDADHSSPKVHSQSHGVKNADMMTPKSPSLLRTPASPTTIRSTRQNWTVSERAITKDAPVEQKNDRVSSLIDYLRRKINHVLNIESTIKTESYDKILKERDEREENLKLRIEKSKQVYRRSLKHDTEIQAYVSSLLKSRQSPDTLINEQFSIPIHIKDLGTLLPKQWLNDEVINLYFQILQNRNKSFTHLPRIFCMNTFFYTTLESHGYERVKRWSRRFKYEDLDYLLIPIHLGSHWTLGTVDIGNRCICYFDSLSSKGIGRKCIKILKDYLIQERQDKGTHSLDGAGDWEEYIPSNIPTQHNGYDCGVFTCQYATCIVSLPVTFSIKKYCESNRLFDFDQSNINLIRNYMIALLAQYDPSKIDGHPSYISILQFEHCN